MPPDSPHLGLLILLGAHFLASVQGLITRFLAVSLAPGRSYHPSEVLLARMGSTFLGCQAWLYFQRVPNAPWGPRGVRGLLVARSLGGLVGVYGLYNSFRYLPMPDAIVITFLAPTLTGFAVSQIPSLHEPFTLAEKAGGLFSLLGVILIARPEFLTSLLVSHSDTDLALPSASEIPPVTPTQRLYAVLIALVGVLGATMSYTTIRWIGTRTHPLISVSYYSGLVTVVSAIVLLCVPGTFIVPVGALEWALLAAISVSGFAMQYLLTLGLQMTKAGRAGVMSYTQVVFAAGFEWVVWRNAPDVWSVLGGGMVLGSAMGVALWKSKMKVVEEEVVVGVPDEERPLLEGRDVA